MHTCFKARVVMLASKFPGFYFSSYYFLNFITTEAIVSENQFKFIIKELTNQTIKDLPQEILNIQLNDAKLIENKEIMRFTSEIYSRIDKNRVWVLNYRAIKYKIEEMLQMLTNKDQFLKRRGFESRQRKRQKKWQCQKGNPKFVGTRTLNPLHHKWWSVH